MEVSLTCQPSPDLNTFLPPVPHTDLVVETAGISDYLRGLHDNESRESCMLTSWPQLFKKVESAIHGINHHPVESAIIAGPVSIKIEVASRFE